MRIPKPTISINALRITKSDGGTGTSDTNISALVWQGDNTEFGGTLSATTAAVAAAGGIGAYLRTQTSAGALLEFSADL